MNGVGWIGRFVLAVDGARIGAADALARAVAAHRAGGSLELTVSRPGRANRLTLRVRSQD